MKKSLASRVGLKHPDVFARVRAACCEPSAESVDLNDHAARIVLKVKARSKRRAA